MRSAEKKPGPPEGGTPNWRGTPDQNGARDRDWSQRVAVRGTMSVCSIGVGGGDAGLGQAELAADDVGALRDGRST